MKKILYSLFILFVPFAIINAAEQSYNTLFDIDSVSVIEDCSNSTNFTVFNNGLYWYARWSGATPSKSGSETISCKLRSGSNKNYTLYYSSVAKNVNQSVLVSINNLDPIFNANDAFSNIYKITDVGISGSNLDVSKCVKDGVSCLISAKDFSKEGTETVTLKYIDEENISYTISISVSISSSKVYLNIGGYGTCTTSGWTLDNNINMYYKKTVNNVTLPSCTPKNTNLIKFEGWVPTNSRTSTSTVDEFDLTVGNCKNIPGLVKAGGSVDNTVSTYSVCYSYVTTFEFLPDGGTMSGVTCDSNSNGACLVLGKSSLKLPNVTSSNSKYQFAGWIDSRNGNVHKANTTVSIEDGTKVTFRAKYDLKNVNENHAFTVGISLNSGSATLDELVNVEGLAFDNARVISGNEFASVEKRNGDIIVVPQKLGQTVVQSTVKDGAATDTYTITIDVYDSNSPIRRTEYAVVDEDSFEVTWDEEQIVNITDTGSLGVCDTYTVSNGYYTPYYVNGNHRFNLYRVTSGCGTNKEYRSMCLDPGLLGPGGGQTYKFHHKLDLSDSYERVLYMLVSELVDKKDIASNADLYGAVNFLGRTFSFLTGRQRSDYIEYKDHYDIYAAAASGNMSGFKSKSTSFKWGSGYSASGSFKSYVDSLYAKAVTTYYGGYSAVDEEDSEILLKNDETKFDWPNSTTLVVTRTGKIKLPKGATNAKFNNNCSSFSGYSCSGTSIGSSVDADGYRNYTIKITISNVNKNTPVPDEDGKRLQFTLSYDGGMSKGTAFMIEHQTNTYAYQRMILINLGSNEFVIYGNINGDGCNTSNPALNPNNCTESSCNININLFTELNCCNKIADKTSYAFKHLCSGGDCTYDSFTPVCGNSGSKYEITQISEARTAAGDANYSCIIDVDNMTKTNNLKDAVGNEYSLDLYKNNKYCRVSCKEDWFYTTGVYGNFVGDKAVTAGSYFIIKDDLFLSNKRSCATTYINYGQYMVDVTAAARELVKAWNDFAKARTEYSALYDIPLSECKLTEPTYYDPNQPYDHYHCDQTYCADYYCESCGQGVCTDWTCALCSCAEYKTDPETGLSTGVCARRNSCSRWSDYACISKGSTCVERYDRYSAYGPSDWKCASCNYDYNDSDDYLGSSGVCRTRQSNNTTMSTCKYDHSDTVYKQNKCKEYSLTTKGNEPYRVHDIEWDRDVTKRLTSKVYTTENTTSGGGAVTNIYRKGTLLYSGNFGHTAGQCKTETCEQMKNRYLNELKSEVDAARGRVNTYISEINSYAEQFAACQNFSLTTESLYDEFKDSSHRFSTFNGNNLYTSTNLSKGAISSTNIVHKFSPFITYSYEEEDYMKMIGSDNYMVPYTEKNNAGGSFGNAQYGGTPIKVSKFIYQTDYSNSTTKDESIYNGSVSNESANMSVLNSDRLGGTSLSSFSCIRTDPEDNSCIGYIQLCPSYSGYETIYNESGSLCHTGSFSYYQVHYIRQSVYNGSYWKNKGLWYINNEDEKSHADTLSEAASRSYVVYSRGVEDSWSVLGGYNVFPISMNTRANLYQYYYNFFNIGMYNDGSLGRIMGGEVDLTGRKVNNSHSRTVVAFNTHACFYEVVESICRCCGEKIVPYVNEVTGVDTKYYSSKYRGSGQMSDIDMKATQGTLAMYTNSVSLSNFSSSANRVLGANWQAQTPFFYAGERFTTNQGSELLSAIQSVGDSVYTKYPDYSYTLSPSAIAKVREYNKSHSYAIDTKNLKIYGRVPFKDSDKFNGGEQITFNHYGSKYLESTLYSYITPEYKGHTLVEKTGPNSICTVNEGQVKNQYGKQNYSSSCRWVDYNTSSGYRLAFK